MQRRAERRRSVASPVDHSEQVSSGTCETALLDDVLFRDGCGRSRGSIPFSFCQGHSRTSTQRLKGRYRPSSREERAKKSNGGQRLGAGAQAESRISPLPTCPLGRARARTNLPNFERENVALDTKRRKPKRKAKRASSSWRRFTASAARF